MAAENDEQDSEARGNARLLPPERPFRGPLSGFEYELAQLYRAWPKPRVRKDN